MHSVCCCSLPVWTRGFVKKGIPWPIFAPPCIRPWADLAEKLTILVRYHVYFIPTTFYQNQAVLKKKFKTTTDERTTDGALLQKLTRAFGSGELKRKRRRSDSVLWQKPLYKLIIRKPKDNIQTPKKTSSITQRLRTDLGRSVGVTTVIQLVWLNRFTDTQPSH